MKPRTAAFGTSPGAEPKRSISRSRGKRAEPPPSVVNPIPAPAGDSAVPAHAASVVVPRADGDKLASFLERLRRIVKYEDVYLRAYSTILGPRSVADFFRLYNGLSHHQVLGCCTLAVVFCGVREAVEGQSDGRGRSPEQGTKSLAGEPGLSLKSSLILPK